MFPMIFQSLMGLGKSRCDVPIGTTQRWVCPNVFTYYSLDIENYCPLDLCFAFTYYIIISIMEGSSTCGLNR